MNALWITRMSAYRNSPLCVESAKKIIGIKIGREKSLLKKYKVIISDTKIREKTSLNGVLLEEARMARKFWREFKKLLPQEVLFPGRKAREKDTVNHLLDIGYHHLTNKVRRILVKYGIPGDLALLHVARNADSLPLAYDLVEMFRSDIVESEILRFLRLKKKITGNMESEVAHFLGEINERLGKKHYLKDFDMCHTYEYYMEVQILKFVKAVDHKEIFKPLRLPTRHENRCS